MIVPTFNTVAELRHWRRQFGAEVRLGFVPTMGNLHDGHLSLVDVALARGCEVVVVSIYVNQQQFGPREDFDVYPRTLSEDLGRLEGLVRARKLPAGALAVFAPAAREMCPGRDGGNRAIEAGASVKCVTGTHIEAILRPFLYDAIATVVLKLFNAVNPTIAVFGRKDQFQCDLVREMVQDLLVPVELVFAPTVREASGVAMSSRNAQLKPEHRAATAPLLFAAASEAISAWHAACGGHGTDPLRFPTTASFAARTLVDLAADRLARASELFRVQYVDVSELDAVGSLALSLGDLTPEETALVAAGPPLRQSALANQQFGDAPQLFEQLEQKPWVLSVAVFVEGKRLVDAIIVQAPTSSS